MRLYRPRWGKYVTIFLGSLALVWIGHDLIGQVEASGNDRLVGYIIQAGFAIWAVVQLLHLVPGMVYLRLDASGLTYRGLLKRQHWGWSQIKRVNASEQSMAGVSKEYWIVFDRIDTPVKDTGIIGLTHRSADCAVPASPFVRGQKGAEALEAEINAWREKFS